MSDLLIKIEVFRGNESNPVQTITENVNSNKTIKNLQEILSNKVNGDIKNIKFNGSVLNPDRTLNNCEIRSGSTLQIIVVNEVCRHYQVL